VRSVTEEYFSLSRVNESETLDCNLSSSVRCEQSWNDIKDKWIEEPKGLVITGVALSIDCDFNIDHIRFSVLWHGTFDKFTVRQGGFDENVVLWLVSESAVQVRAFSIEALESSSHNIDCDIFCRLHVAEAGLNLGNVGTLIDLETRVSLYVHGIYPVLFVERQLYNSVLSLLNWWSRPH